MKAVIGFHHAPGIMSGVPLIVAGLHKNIHVQAIAATLIGAGGIGVMTGCLVSVLGDNHLFKNTVVVAEAVIFFFARHVVCKACARLGELTL